MPLRSPKKKGAPREGSAPFTGIRPGLQSVGDAAARHQAQHQQDQEHRDGNKEQHLGDADKRAADTAKSQ
jgi:hypothetical protein